MGIWAEWTLVHWGSFKETVSNSNCLFNLISILLVGNESVSTELRMKTVRKFIRNRHKLENLKYATIKSKSIKKEVLGTIKMVVMLVSCYMKVLAAVTNRHIYSIYPMVEYALVDRSFFQWYIARQTNEESSSTERVDVFNIMWTQTGNTTLKGWHPNHFVPCFLIKVLLKFVGRTSNKKKYKRQKKEVKEDLNKIQDGNNKETY